MNLSTLPLVPKVSVIMPVYNVAKYLRHSLSCLLNQTLREIEVLCVDDGSSDASTNVIRDFMAKDSRIKLFLNEHSYAGAARNTGLDHAVGEYVMFLDPDDYYDVTMIEELYTRAKRSQVDVLLCGIYNVFERSMSYTGPSQKPGINDFYDGKIFNAKDLANSVWSLLVYPYNKIYRKDFLVENKIRFQTIQNTNDASFAFEVVIAAERMMLHDKAYYYYRYGRPGNTRTTKGKNLTCVIQAYEYAYEKCRRYPAFNLCEAGFKAVTVSNYAWHFYTYAAEGVEEKRFFFDYTKGYLETNFVSDSTVQEFLKYYSFNHYCVARIISKYSYEKTCKILRMSGPMRRRITPSKEEICFLRIPIWRHCYSAKRESMQIFGVPYIITRFAGQWKKSCVLGIPFSKKSYLTHSVSRYLHYIKNRISTQDSQRVCCVFSLPSRTVPFGEKVQEIVKKYPSSVHFVVQNVTHENLIKKFVPLDKIDSILRVPVGMGLRKELWDSLWTECNFLGMSFIAILLNDNDLPEKQSQER